MSVLPKPTATNRPKDLLATASLNITVLSGGPGGEREVSLASGRCIAAALVERGHRIAVCDVSPDDLSALDKPADIVFVALHGPFGEDGTIQAELERRGITFTGSGSASSALAMNKVKAKCRFVEAGLPTPRFDIAHAGQLGEVMTRWRMPVVVKPVSSGSSLDTHIVRDPNKFGLILAEVVKKHGVALVEELIDGPEIAIGVVGGEALPPIEIRTAREFYDYQAKYIDDNTQFLFDMDLPGDLLQRMQSMSVQAARALGCRDFCRVDWMVDEITHNPYILEANTIPGFTAHSLLPKAAAHAGIAFDELCQRIVDLASARVSG